MNTSDAERLQRLEHAELTREVISRYCLALDTDDLNMLRGVFSDDIVLHRPPGEPLTGNRVMQFFTDALAEKVTHRKHFNTNPLITRTEGKTLAAQSYFFAFHHNHGELSLAWGSYDLSVRIEGGAALITALTIDTAVPIAPVRTMIAPI